MKIDPDIEALKNEIIERDDSGEKKSWVLMGYENGDVDSVVVLGSGNGDYAEFIGNFDDSSVSYGFHRMNLGIDDEHRSQKCIFVTWIGQQSPKSLKGASLNHKHTIRDLFEGKYHVDFQASGMDELEFSSVQERVRKAGGADYDAGGLYDANREEKVGLQGDGTVEGEAVGRPVFQKPKAKARGARRLVRKAPE